MAWSASSSSARGWGVHSITTPVNLQCKSALRGVRDKYGCRFGWSIVPHGAIGISGRWPAELAFGVSIHFRDERFVDLDTEPGSLRQTGIAVLVQHEALASHAGRH